MQKIEFEIRKGRLEEIVVIKKLLRKTWDDAYGHLYSQDELDKMTAVWHSLERLKEQVENPKVVFLVAEKGGEMIAVINTEVIEGDTAVVQRLYIRSEHQRQGLGSTLIEEVFKRGEALKKIRLEVEKTNEGAKAFYEKNGFRVVGEMINEAAGIKMPCFVMEKEYVV